MGGAPRLGDHPARPARQERQLDTGAGHAGVPGDHPLSASGSRPVARVDAGRASRHSPRGAALGHGPRGPRADAKALQGSSAPAAGSADAAGPRRRHGQDGWLVTGSRAAGLLRGDCRKRDEALPGRPDFPIPPATPAGRPILVASEDTSVPGRSHTSAIFSGFGSARAGQESSRSPRPDGSGW
jgi:hypothetical protein